MVFLVLCFVYLQCPNLLIMKTFLNLNLLIAFLCANVSFSAEKPTNFDFDGHLMTHQVEFQSEAENITQEEFDKIDSFISEIADIDINQISIIGSETTDEELVTRRTELVREIITDYNFSDYLISTLNDKEEEELSPRELELLNRLDALNEKVVIVVAPRRLVAGSFFEDDIAPGEKFNIENIKFDAGLRYVSKETMPLLEDLADFLTNRQDIYFTIQGHVCCVDPGIDARDEETGERNLSRMRAKFVHDYLIEQGVHEDRISYEGLAGNYSLGRTEEEDRRVEIYIRRVEGMAGSAY